MADKTIWDYPTLATADPNDLILMASDEETYNMKVETLKNAMGEAASKPPIVRNGNWWVWSATQNDYVDSGTAATGPQGSTGDTGAAAGFGTVSATVDGTTGTPSVDITTSGPDTAKNIAFEFHNIKGTKGDTGNTGPAAGFGTVSATVDGTTGTPSVDITTSGPDTAKNIAFAFHNMKGETGDITPELQALADAAAQSATDAADSASDASASQQAAADSAQEADDTAAEIEQKLDRASAYGEVGPVPIAAISDALPLDAAKLVVGIEPVQSGSGDPSPDNVRPITGWTGANVTRTGFNVWDEEWEVGALISNGSVDSSSNRRTTSFIPVIPSTAYYATNRYVISGRYAYYDADKNVIEYSYDGFTTPLFTTPSDAYYLRITLQSGYGTTYNHDISINYPSTDHDYHPGTSNDTIPISWQSEAGTVYGGQMDVSNGVLTVDRGNIASYAGETLPGAWISSMDVYTAGGTPTTGAQVVYELATPITYQLTPQQITMLQGENNVWADCGDTTVGYWRNDSLSINKAIGKRMPDITPLQSGLAATQSGIGIIVSGDRASMAVPVGGFAYIKDNPHGLADGLYTNTSSAVFPTVGGTADSTVFTAASGGGLNALNSQIAWKMGNSTTGTSNISLPGSFNELLVICYINNTARVTINIPYIYLNDSEKVFGSAAYALNNVTYGAEIKITKSYVRLNWAYQNQQDKKTVTNVTVFYR